ncbi:unnamed protein product, partial [Effrenium voratum]
GLFHRRFDWAMQLRIVVTGDTNSGKSTLSNAVIGSELLPTSNQSETSVITYVVPQQVGEGNDSKPVLRCYGGADLEPVEGTEEVRQRLHDLNLRARAALGVQCVECRLECPLRDSLNVFHPPAAEWQDVQFLDIGGANEILNPAVQVCSDLAYALSHRLIVCIRHDQITSRATQQLLLDIRCKAPYHFSDELARRDICPLILAITQVDQVLDAAPGESWEVLRQSLRAVLHATLADCGELTQVIPIVILSAKNSLQNLLTGGDQPQFEWNTFEELLINTAGLKRDIVRNSKVRRAAFIHELLQANLVPFHEEWPYHAQCLWHSRRDLGKKLAIGGAVAAGSVGTAVAFGVFLSASSAAAVAAAEAGAASAEAAAAAAAANSWWAWAFGFGQMSAAASAAAGAATTAEAAAATAAASAGAWGLGSALAGVSTALTVAAGSSLVASEGVSSVAGMAVVHASAVRVRDVRMAFRCFKPSASAERIKAGKTYRDVLFYPDGTATWSPLQPLGSMMHPFLLLNKKTSAYLTFDGTQVFASSARDRPGQLWWAVPESPAGDVFVLQNADHLCNLRVEDPAWFSPDRRKAIRCTAEVPGQSWKAEPCEEGCIRLQNLQHGQYLYYDGFFTGAFDEAHPDQNWQVLPQVPFYLGGFKETAMSGKGQFFWPNGAPLFKGHLKGGKLLDGFVFDERCICHGHFSFTEDGPILEGLQPDEAVEGQTACLLCEQPSMATMGKALKPCNHAGTCEACATKVRECPYCRTPIEGVHRVM